MARQPISEYRAKQMLYQAFSLEYSGQSFSSSEFDSLLINQDAVVLKVDQGIKKRNKLGLVKVGISPKEATDIINQWQKQGYQQFLVEPLIKHTKEQEKYLALEITREGIQVSYSNKGGVDVEEHPKDIKLQLITIDTQESLDQVLDLPPQTIDKIMDLMESKHLSFVEINPLVVQDEHVYFLDAAVEVDTAARLLVEGAWTEADYVSPGKSKSQEEIAIRNLNRQSQASLSLELINPDGTIWLLLSGGGASIAVADEVYNLGFSSQLANFGEYSGNPNTEETYLYTKNLLSLLLKSQGSPKVLIIAGGVANFTDIKKTFQGVIQALKESQSQLKEQGVKVFVRRGGPNQTAGLQAMEDFLKSAGIYGHVVAHELILTDIVNLAIQKINNE